MSAGYAALASVFVVGKRKFAPGERSLPHNVAFVALGTGLLWFGWFGFNSGDGYAANGFAAQAFVNTDIAGSIAMCTWLAITWWRDGKPSLVGALTGAVAGLATVTPCAGYVPTWASFIIGLRRRFAVLLRRHAQAADAVGRRPRRVGRPRRGRHAGHHPARRLCHLRDQPDRRPGPDHRPLPLLRLAGHRPPSSWPPMPSWPRTSSSS